MEMIKTREEFDDILARATREDVPVAQRATDYQSLGRTIIALQEMAKWGKDIATWLPKVALHEEKFIAAVDALEPWLTEDAPDPK